MHPIKDHTLMADPYTMATFRALVEAIVPSTPALTVYGAEQEAGAVDLYVHEYMIWELDHTLALFFGISITTFPLSVPTAMLLNAGAVQLIASGLAQDTPYNSISRDIPFSVLSPVDRIKTLAILEQLHVDLQTLPPPYQNDGGLVKFIVDYLNRGTMFGFYSEWSAYGTTRLATPTARRLQYFPISWSQVGYPGVSLGYRALRGFLLTIEREGGESIVV